MLSASLGSYLVFVNGTPPSERAVGNDRERKKPRPAESLRRREREMMIMMMRKRRTYSISLSARLLPQLRFFFILNRRKQNQKGDEPRLHLLAVGALIFSLLLV